MPLGVGVFMQDFTYVSYRYGKNVLTSKLQWPIFCGEVSMPVQILKFGGYGEEQDS